MQIILAVEAPPNSAQLSPAGYPQEWLDFLSNVKSASGFKDVTELVKGTWVLDANGGLPFVLEVAQLAKEAKFPYKALLVNESTELTAAKSFKLNISAATLRKVKTSK